MLTDALKILSFDFIPCSNKKEDTKVRINGIGTESQDPSSFMGTEYFLEGLTASDVEKLQNGKAYLEFEILLIDNGQQTLNGKLYPLTQMKQALKDPGFIRQMNYGGVPGQIRLAA